MKWSQKGQSLRPEGSKVGMKSASDVTTLWYYKMCLLLLLLIFWPQVLNFQRMKKITLCNTKKYKNQTGMNFTPPSQNSHAVRSHCTAESEWRVAEIKSWFLCRRPTDQQAYDRVSKGKRDPTHWLDPMAQRQLAEKCDEPECLNSSPSYEWLPLLLLNELHGQLLQRISRPTDRWLLRPKSVAFQPPRGQEKDHPAVSHYYYQSPTKSR